MQALAEAHRSDLRDLTDLAEADVAEVLRGLSDAEVVREALMDTLPALVELYGSAAATMAADWYEDLRDEAGAAGRFSPIVAELPDGDRTDALARWGVGPLFSAEPDSALVLSKVAGGLQRIIADADRQTVRISAVADRRAGWVREGTGECDWCQKYIDGVVHYVAGYDFDAHDRCQCIAVPTFE